MAAARRTGADPGPSPDPAAATRIARRLAEVLEAELRQAETALRAAGGGIETAPYVARPAVPALDRAVRATARALGLPVSGLDPLLAPLAESGQPPGTALPALPAALLAADALGTARPAIGLLEPAEAGLGIAVPILPPGQARAIAVLVARFPPAFLAERLAAVLDGAEGAGGVASARLVAVRAEGAPVETLAWIRAGATGEAPPAWPDGPDSVTEAPSLPPPNDRDAGQAMPGQAPPMLLVATRRLALAPRCAVVVATPVPPAPLPLAAPPPAEAAPRQPSGGVLAALGLGGALVGGLLAAGLGRQAMRVPDGRSPGEIVAAEQEARQSLQELRAICDTIPVGLALLDARGRMLSANARLAAFAGLPAEALPGRDLAHVLPPPLAEAIEASQAQVMREGRPVLDRPLAVEAPGTLRHSRHLLYSCHPVRDRTGRVEAVSVAVQDITERARAEAGRDLLVKELNHRVKNCLATVQTIARQTLRHAGDDPAGFERSFGERLRTLARAHDLLTENSWGETELGQVVQSALAPWLDDPRLLIAPEPDIMLRPSQAQALMLALHELVTNAAKHGALTRETGCVEIGWRLDGEGMVQLRWTERGGPPVAPRPARAGFGTRLLEQALRHDLGSGSASEIVFDTPGLRATIGFRPGRVLAPPAVA